MKRIILFILIFVMSFASIDAKTTYLPTHFTQINISGEGNITLADSTCSRELSMFASDGRYSITVMHDSVTAERVKAIKRMKAASGWAAAAAVFSGISATLNPVHSSWDAVRYMNDMNTMTSATMLSVASKQGAKDLQHVSINIIIENFSEREMVINDMSRGLTWYVPAHNYINITVGNPEVNKFRVAYADCMDQKKDYITVQAGNYLEKVKIVDESEDYWVFPVYKEAKTASPYSIPDEVIVHYELVSKATYEHKIISIQDYKKKNY